jgi:hypothetical protein
MLKLPSQARLLELLTYDPATGILRWNVRRGGAAQKGSIAGTRNKKCINIIIDGTSYVAHRIIWKLVTGQEPSILLDHRNNDPWNNRWNNIREATLSDNMANARRWKVHSVGLKGVRAKGNKFEARINRRSLGHFDTAAEAHLAYAAAAKQRFGHFSNSG